MPKDINEKVMEKTEELSSRTLEYNPLEPIFSETNEEKKNVENLNYIEMSKEKPKTSNRENMQELHYPKYEFGKPYHFEFPQSNEIKITNTSKPFVEQPLTKTTISESYAESLNWNNDKISRDLLQNFFDGHGQTLDGVAFDVQPSKNGKQKVRISGKSLYSPDKAILLGESSKKDNIKAAGEYGEGLKMVVLKLLKEKGAENVNIASDNWNVNWQFVDSNMNNKKVLAYELNKSEPINGNYIEFETNDSDFIDSIIKSFDRFYHSNNPAFKCPDFENDKFGIKLLENDQENGKLFISGQAFEIKKNNWNEQTVSYEGLQGANVFIKEKIPKEINGMPLFDPSRDRTALNDRDIERIGSWLANSDMTSEHEAVNVINSLENYWINEPKTLGMYSGMMRYFTSGFIDGCIYRKNKLNIKFPNEKYIADSIKVSPELKNSYINAGYTLCSPLLSYLGMSSVEDVVKQSRQHSPLEPTEEEKNKLIILKEALKILTPVLNVGDKPLFSEDELSPQIFIFDRNSSLEDPSYRDTNAEAIVKANKSYGYWIDRTFLNSDFSTILATELHELTHKFGGDESSIFSYKLTDVLRKVLSGITEYDDIGANLKILEQVWNNLSNADKSN